MRRASLPVRCKGKLPQGKNGKLRSEKDVWRGFRTGVQFPSPPPFYRYASTCKIAPMPDGLFAVVVKIDDHDTEARRQTKKATYAEIRAWVEKTYGQVVTNLDISRTKQRCGLATVPYNGRQASGRYQDPRHRPEKEALVEQALRHFGLI